MIKYLLLLLSMGALIATGCDEQGRSITYAKVLDSHFETIQVIEESETLNELNQIWHNRTTVDSSTEFSFSYKVDILTGETSTRWLYDPRGYATILSISRTPIYKFKDAGRLNAILIPRQN